MTEIPANVIYTASAGWNGAHLPHGARFEELSFVKVTEHAGGPYLLANNVDRDEADRLRMQHPSAIVSRNADGTYRITRGR